MKTYSELFGDNGIIKALKKVDPTKYNEIFGEEYDADTLDGYITFSNGEYNVIRCIENELENNADNIDNIARYLWLKYYSSWKSVLKSLEVGYNDSYKETTTAERNKKNESTLNDTTTDTNKVFAYNSETASNDTMSDNTHTSDGTGNESETTSTIKSGYNYGSSLFDLLSRYKDFQIENNFISVVKDDIIAFVCYDIY